MMTALALACLIGAAPLTAEAAPAKKNSAAHAAYKKPARAAPQATATPRGPSEADRWMDRASGASNSGGGGGGGGY
jgi:hypothetical protein